MGVLKNLINNSVVHDGFKVVTASSKAGGATYAACRCLNLFLIPIPATPTALLVGAIAGVLEIQKINKTSKEFDNLIKEVSI